jgi:hypothetical protein
MIRGRGVVESYEVDLARTGGPLIQGFFFRAADFRDAVLQTERRFPCGINARMRSRDCEQAIYFLLPTGGGQMFALSLSRTGGPRHKLFREFPRTVLPLQRSSVALKNCREIQGGGVGRPEPG